MELTVDTLKKELVHMRGERDQLEVDFHAISGAIKFCEALILRSEAKEDPPKENEGDQK